jgi:CheY-like chemotaxis protein
MVYGFARQSNGHCKIYSESGVGTTVKIYLPRLADAERIDRSVRPSRAGATVPAGKIILISEDDPVVPDLMTTVLREFACTVFEAPDGPGALSILETDQPLDLLVTDIGLPGLDGRVVVDAARNIRPNLPVLFVTGYAKNAALAQGFLESGMALLTKPFTIAAFLQNVAALLDR